MKWLLVLSIALLAVPVRSAEPDAVTRTEVAHLLEYLETSAASFSATARGIRRRVQRVT